MYIPKAPARATENQATAINPPGGRCAAVPRGGGGPVVDDISRTGSSILAIGGRVFGDRGITGGRRATGRGKAGAEGAEHYGRDRQVLCGQWTADSPRLNWNWKSEEGSLRTTQGIIAR